MRPGALSVEYISALELRHLRSVGSLDKVARLRKDGQVAGEYAKSKGKRKKAKKGE
jgi:hypothetical protein